MDGTIVFHLLTDYNEFTHSHVVGHFPFLFSSYWSVMKIFELESLFTFLAIFKWLILKIFLHLNSYLGGNRASNKYVQYIPEMEPSMGKFLTLFLTITVWFAFECIKHIIHKNHSCCNFICHTYVAQSWSDGPCKALWSCGYCDWRFIAFRHCRNETLKGWVTLSIGTTTAR